MATALDVFVKLETTTSESSEKVSASLEASWSGFGVKVGAGFTFSQTLEETLEHNSVSVTSKAYGVERDWIPNANVDNLDEIVEEYNSVSNEGSGTALTLSRYDDHPDYIEIELECGSTFESLEHDEYLAEKYVDVAVEAKLFAEELLTKPYTSCGVDLAQDALTLYADLVETPEEDYSIAGFFDGYSALYEIKTQWDADRDTCSDNAENTSLEPTPSPTPNPSMKPTPTPSVKPDDMVTLYEHGGFSGEAWTITDLGTTSLTLFNDKTSSIRVFDGYMVTVCEHGGWGGG
jgi:hypothetical protein